ncbi:hypothetical protein Cni_G11403 [Canna indica]|uniref:RING-type domain-containing protein n=1 Tax=Canna indica TaxID=4628 RepID=A0AAQ3Q9I2_9LILI|nr:hypothetical protein Cni_G11403 [Canna indica]
MGLIPQAENGPWAIMNLFGEQILVTLHPCQHEGLSFGSQGDGVVAHYGSSLSSNSKSNRSWERGESLGNHPLSASDDAFSYISSPSDTFQNHHLTPPPTQGVNIEEHVRDPASGPLIFSRLVEGTLGLSSFNGSISSRSDGSEYESISKSYGYGRRSFSNRRSFMSKAIHPLSFPDHVARGEEQNGSFSSTISSNNLHSDYRSISPLPELHSLGFSETVANFRKDPVHWSRTSSIDFTDICETLEAEAGPSNVAEVSKCGLCQRLLSQRSPWGSRRIVRSGDMPIASILSCWHVYHAECLERITPKAHRNDPPCPLCAKSDENVSDQWAICQMKNELPRLRSPGGEGPSSIWSCAQVGDCVEGALHMSKHNKMVLLSRSRLKRQLSSKGIPVKERAENLKKSGLRHPDVFQGGILGGQGAVRRLSSMTSSPGLTRW